MKKNSKISGATGIYDKFLEKNTTNIYFGEGFQELKERIVDYARKNNLRTSAALKSLLAMAIMFNEYMGERFRELTPEIDDYAKDKGVSVMAATDALLRLGLDAHNQEIETDALMDRIPLIGLKTSATVTSADARRGK